MPIYYTVYFVQRHVFNIQSVNIESVHATHPEQVIEDAKNAVKAVINRSDTITAIVGDLGAFINTGNSEFRFEWIGE